MLLKVIGIIVSAEIQILSAQLLCIIYNLFKAKVLRAEISDSHRVQYMLLCYYYCYGGWVSVCNSNVIETIQIGPLRSVQDLYRLLCVCGIPGVLLFDCLIDSRN
jgi:hypothetical protein